MRLSLSHIADEEWRAVFMGENALLAPRGFEAQPGEQEGQRRHANDLRHGRTRVDDPQQVARQEQ
jgi:hypothetical protein